MDLAKMVGMIRAYRAGAPFGDVVVLKVDALSAASAGRSRVAERLESLRGYTPTQDLTVLRELAAGTLGREYARFLDANGITPLAVSDALRERFAADPYALRYTETHDIHHVLAGFDTGLAGEAGVLAFNVGQGAAPVGRSMLSVVRAAYTVVSPSDARAIATNLQIGLEMGRQAKLVIATPIESYFEEPLADVRWRLRIPDPREAGVLPSRRATLH